MREIIRVVHPYLLLAAGFANLVLILLVLFSRSEKRIKFLFAYFTAGICGYMVTYGLMSLSTDDHRAFIISEIGQLFINQISPALYIFSVYQLNLRSQKLLAWLSPLGGFFIVQLLRTIDHQDIIHYWWGTFNVYSGHDMPVKLGIYFIWFFTFMGLSFRNFVHALSREADPRKRLQLRYLITALAIAYLASWDHLPIIGIGVYPFGYIPVTMFSCIVFYAITKHQFLDLNVVLKRISVVFLIYAFLLLASLPAAIPLVKALLKGTSFGPTTIVLGIGIVIGIIFSFGPFIYAYFVRNSYWLRGHVTTGLAHELKSPLNAIQSAIDIMSDQVEAESFDRTKTVDYIGMIKKNAARMESYVQDLLNLAKIQDENISLQKQETDFSEMVADVLDTYRPLAEAKGLTLKFKIQPNLKFVCDGGKIRQSISNILSNALKFSENGPIEVKLEEQNGELRFSVSDSGLGLNKTDLKRVFDRFYQAKPNVKGSGIGLTIAKAWVEAHGGKIWAESEGEGKGTTVSFTLPLT